MTQSIKKIGVFTSGGDSSGMNAAIRAVVRSAIYHEVEVVGIYRGYEGMIEGDFISLDVRSVSHIINRGGTILKSARSKEFMTKEGREKAYNHLKEHQIDALVAIGGDGTFTGASIFSTEYNIPIVGLPGTIDNDIFGTDATIGYDTASNNAMDAIDKIRDTATSHNRLFFVEVMGRDAGFIALQCAIATGAKAVMLPETHIEPKDLLTQIRKGKKNRKKSNIVIVGEGNKNGNATELANIIGAMDDSYEIKVTVLGHIQRGGSPTIKDRVLASRLGVASIDALLDGQKNVMIGQQNNQVCYVPFEKAIKNENTLNEELLRVVDILSI
ncbi:MAG: 6-phosphofructokinase [Chitinophagales bacterium]